MFKDERRYEVWDEIRQSDLATFRELLTDAVLRETAERAGLKVVRCALCGPHLIWLGIVAAMQCSLSFASVLTLTVRMLDLSANGLPESLAQARRREKRNSNRRKQQRSKHDPHGKDPVTVSEEAFAKARKLMPPVWWSCLIELLTERFEAEHAELVHWKQFRMLALDGTTLRLPQKKRLKQHFGTSSNGKKRVAQARMTMLQLPLVRLPWRYELCPITEGERTIAERMLKDLRKDDLVLMDQGFWSYGAFHQIQASRAYFGIRRYPRVKFRTIKRLGQHDRLVEWKMPSGPRWRQSGLPKSIRLRVIDYQLAGFRPSAVVTNVLDPKQISRDEWVHVTTESEWGRPLDRAVRLRQGLYHRRWEIEVSFHEMKVTQKMESSLRSHTPESIHYEVAGHVVLYLLIRWLMVKAAQAAEDDGDPLGLSFKHAFEELMMSWNVLIAAPPEQVVRLVRRLLGRIASSQVPFRPGRHEPRPRNGKHKHRGKGKYTPSHKLESNQKQS